jgi:AraC-like DNA-binding protein
VNSTRVRRFAGQDRPPLFSYDTVARRCDFPFRCRQGMPDQRSTRAALAIHFLPQANRSQSGLMYGEPLMRSRAEGTHSRKPLAVATAIRPDGGAAGGHALDSAPPEPGSPIGQVSRSPGNPTRPTHRPGSEVFRAIVSRESESAGVLSNEDVLTLLQTGMSGFARRRGCSVRTAQRRLAEAGLQSETVVRRVRLKTALASLEMGLPLHVVARWLGYTTAVTFRRFVHRATGTSLKVLREHGRNCAVFLHPVIDCAADGHPKIPACTGGPLESEETSSSER